MSPAEACEYLKNNGLNTRGYKTDGLSYFCSSTYKEIGSGNPLKNNIAYYVEGTKDNIKTIKLVLNINSISEAEQATRTFSEIASVLTEKATGSPLPDEAKITIMAGINGEWDINGINAILKRNDWPTGKGYDLKLLLR